MFKIIKSRKKSKVQLTRIDLVNKKQNKESMFNFKILYHLKKNANLCKFNIISPSDKDRENVLKVFKSPE